MTFQLYNTQCAAMLHCNAVSLKSNHGASLTHTLVVGSLREQVSFRRRCAKPASGGGSGGTPPNQTRGISSSKCAVQLPLYRTSFLKKQQIVGPTLKHALEGQEGSSDDCATRDTTGQDA